jgi:hypothetical protein
VLGGGDVSPDGAGLVEQISVGIHRLKESCSQVEMPTPPPFLRFLVCLYRACLDKWSSSFFRRKYIAPCTNEAVFSHPSETLASESEGWTRPPPPASYSQRPAAFSCS